MNTGKAATDSRAAASAAIRVLRVSLIQLYCQLCDYLYCSFSKSSSSFGSAASTTHAIDLDRHACRVIEQKRGFVSPLWFRVATTKRNASLLCQNKRKYARGHDLVQARLTYADVC